MKKFLLSLITASAVLFSTPSLVSAQQITDSQRETVVQTIKSQLPMHMTDGMTWTGITLIDNGTVLKMTFAINAAEMGTTNAEFHEQLTKIDDEEFSKLLGTSFTSMLDMMGCDAKIVFTFSDKTPSYTRTVKK